MLPPFWRTAWFVSLAALTVAAGAYALYRYRLAQLLRLERVRTRIAADLHDDIGASLSRIALQPLLLNGWVKGEWGVSDNNRRARYYTLTAAGRKRLGAEREEFERLVFAIQRVLDTA